MVYGAVLWYMMCSAVVVIVVVVVAVVIVVVAAAACQPFWKPAELNVGPASLSLTSHTAWLLSLSPCISELCLKGEERS